MSRKKKEVPETVVEIDELVDDAGKVVRAGEVRSTPNFLIKFVGKVRRLAKEDVLDERGVKVRAGDYFMDAPEDDEVPTVLINGRKWIELPSGAEQKAGFQHPDAVFLLNNYGHLFKKVVVKDGSPVEGEAGRDGSNADGQESSSSAAQEGGNDTEGVEKDA